MNIHKNKILFVPYKLHFKNFLEGLAVRQDVSVFLPPEKELTNNSKLNGVPITYNQFGVDRIKNLIGRELRTPKYIKNFSYLVRDCAADVLITCEFYHWYTLQGLVYKKLNPKLQFFIVSETKKWPKNIFARFIKKMIFSYIRFNSQHIDAMLVYTEQAREFIHEHLPLMNVLVVPAPVDSNLFFKDENFQFLKDNTLRILFNARYSKYKRHRDLFMAVSHLIQLGYKISVTCISRDDKRLDEVSSLADDLGIRHSVKFLKSLPQVDMPVLYHEHDVVILPSYNEAIGMVVPEAMSCGRATITSDTVGANVYVKNDITGFIFKTGDVPSLIENLIKCFDKDLLKEMGDNAHEHVVTNFSLDIVVSGFENFLKNTEARGL